MNCLVRRHLVFMQGCALPGGKSLRMIGRSAFCLTSMPSKAANYWEIIADNLSKAGWSWGCTATMDREGR